MPPIRATGHNKKLPIKKHGGIDLKSDAHTLPMFTLCRSRSRWSGEGTYHDIHYCMLPHQGGMSRQRLEASIGQLI
jgi:hypothetical protein